MSEPTRKTEDPAAESGLPTAVEVVEGTEGRPGYVRTTWGPLVPTGGSFLGYPVVPYIPDSEPVQWVLVEDPLLLIDPRATEVHKNV